MPKRSAVASVNVPYWDGQYRVAHDIGVYRPKHDWKFEGGITFKTVDPLQRNVPAPMAEYIRESQPEPEPKFKKRRGRNEE